MFNGYSTETVDFLWGIRFNNNREWFQANKDSYTKYLYHPTKELGAHIFEPFLDTPGVLCKVSRIYRDARLHPPVPYKESLWICIRRDVEWWADNPCLYFEINPEGVHYGFFFCKPRTAVLEEMRKDWAANPRKITKLIRDIEKATGVPVTAQTYKRPPKQVPTKALEPFFAWKGQIGCVIQEPFSEATFGPELGQRVKDFLTKLIPLYEYFNQFCV